MTETSPIGKDNAPSFTWREVCAGWTFVDQPSLHVIEERMPPGTFELRHVHELTHQFYFVLQGRATVESGAGRFEVAAMQGIEIPPGLEHQMRNESDTELEFLVISTRRPREDRRNVPGLESRSGPDENDRSRPSSSRRLHATSRAPILAATVASGLCCLRPARDRERAAPPRDRVNRIIPGHDQEQVFARRQKGRISSSSVITRHPTSDLQRPREVTLPSAGAVTGGSGSWSDNQTRTLGDLQDLRDRA